MLHHYSVIENWLLQFLCLRLYIPRVCQTAIYFVYFFMLLHFDAALYVVFFYIMLWSGESRYITLDDCEYSPCYIPAGNTANANKPRFCPFLCDIFSWGHRLKHSAYSVMRIKVQQRGTNLLLHYLLTDDCWWWVQC